MKCPYCGADGKGKFCEYCGSELPHEKEANQTIINNYYIQNDDKAANNVIRANSFSQKKKTTALLLCIFLGFYGGHQFYVGNTKLGILYLFTAGLFGIGWIVDIIRIASGSFTDSNGNLLLQDKMTNSGKRVLFMIMGILFLLTTISSLELKSWGMTFFYLCITALFGYLWYKVPKDN